MSLFRKSPPRKPRRPHPPPTLDLALEKELIKRARKDPDWAFRAAKHKFGLNLPEETEDPIQKLQKQALADALENDPDFIEQVKQKYLQEQGTPLEGDELERRISDAAIVELESNPELLSKAVRRRLDSLLSDHSSSGVGDMLQQLRELRDLEDEIGITKKEGIGGLIDSDVVGKFISILPSLLGKPAPQIPQTYLIETADGRTLQLTSAEYDAYKQRKALSPPKENTPNSKSETPHTPEEDSANSSLINPVDWLPYLDKEPREFAALLASASQETNGVGKAALFTIDILKSRSADNIYLLLLPFKQDAKYREAIEKLESRRDWVEGLVQCFHEPLIA